MNKPSLRIDFNTLFEPYSLKPIEAFDYYLNETWKDLASQSVDQYKGINRFDFFKYYELPLIISRHLFDLFDQDKNDYLSREEFITGMKKLFDNKNYWALTDIVFKLYSGNGNSNSNDHILKEDVRMTLGYIQQPKESIKKKTEGFRNRAIDPEIRAVYHEKVDIVLNETFDKESYSLTKEAYLEAIQTKCSDIFTLLLIYLYDNRPFSNDSLKAYQDRLTPKPQLQSQSTGQTPIQFRRSSVTATATATAIAIEIIAPLYKNSSAMTAMLIPKSKVYFDNDLMKKCTSISSGPKEDVSYYFKPKVYTKKPTNSNTMSIFSKKNSTANHNAKDNTQLNSPLQDGGYMFKITKSKTMKIFWFKIIHKDLFYYQSRSSLIHKGMHHLSNVFISRKGIVEYKEAKLYAFCLIFNKRTRIYYLEKEEEYEQWVSLIERTIDQRDIYNDYEMTTNEDMIIKGKYGLIKPGIQLVTNREVMIKQIDKKTLAKQDNDLVHYEIEILKYSQQRNVIRLYDIYEDSNYIHYILEKCNGVDLFSYIEKRNYRLPEKRTCEIIHKILMSFYYLQTYGIIHRDLKPKNLLMTDSSEDADIRLIGFNLSKIITKKDTCREPFGTLSYVSPEILTEKPYHNPVDIWSVGILTYLLLCGSLPFDDDHSEREIARQTIHDPVSFKNSLWNQYSNEARLFVMDTLNKDQNRRIKIESALVHPWIKRYYSNDVERRLKCTSRDMFKCYTMSVEEEE